MDTPKGWVKWYVTISPRYEVEPHPRLRMGGADQCWFLIEAETGDERELYVRAREYLQSRIGEKWMFSINELLPVDHPVAGKPVGDVYPLDQVVWPSEPTWIHGVI